MSARPSSGTRVLSPRKARVAHCSLAASDFSEAQASDQSIASTAGHRVSMSMSCKFVLTVVVMLLAQATCKVSVSLYAGTFKHKFKDTCKPQMSLQAPGTGVTDLNAHVLYDDK